MTMPTFNPVINPPHDLAQWKDQRQHLRQMLWQMLGDMPPQFTPQVTVLDRAERDDCVVEKILFENGAGAQVYGYFLLPLHQTAALPAVIYHHVHGGKYELGKEELFRERVLGQLPGPALVKAGFAVLAIDAYCFGERQTQGPAGDAETGGATEQALFKHFVWQGSTLWGMMVRDDLLALNYLVTRPEVDAARIGITGMSLGASRATWLAALDDRPRVVVPIAQMTRYQEFAESGRYNGHSIYYYVPGIRKSGLEMDHLVALVAPRLQAILIGDADPLSPIEGVRRVHAYAKMVYALYGTDANLILSVERGVAHQFTPSMFTTMVETLKHALHGL